MTSAPDFLSLQMAFYQLMKQSAALSPLITGVFDYVPDESAYPYVLLDGFAASREWAVDLSNRLLCEQTIRALSNDAIQEKGWRIVRDIATVLYALFDGTALLVGQRRIQLAVGRLVFQRGETSIRSAILTVQTYFV